MTLTRIGTSPFSAACGSASACTLAK
jgi:hypothetical protein